MELDLSPETVDFLTKIELPDLLENCSLDDIVFNDIAALLHILHHYWEDTRRTHSKITLHISN